MAGRTRNRANTPIGPKPNHITLLDLHRALTLGQITTLVGLLFSVIAGIYALGIFTGSNRNRISDIAQAKILADEQAISRSLKSDIQSSKTEIYTLKEKLSDRDARTQELASLVKRLELQSRSNESEIEFLNRFISYVRAPSEASKSTFVNYVCAMWKEAQSQRIHFNNYLLDSFGINLNYLISSELRKVLLDSGISEETIRKANKSDFRIIRAGPIPIEELDQEAPSARSQVDKVLKSTTLIKIISFPDGRRFEIPTEISATVHTRPNCSPL